MEGGLSKRCLQYSRKICLQGKLKFLGVFRHTVTKPQNTCVKQLANSMVFKCLFPKPFEKESRDFKIY